MSALSGDYTGCSVLIYDMQGNNLIDTRVTYYDKQSLRIMVKESPPYLKVGDTCKLLILSSPCPCEFMGRIKKETQTNYIALYQGKEKEERGATRYKVSYPAVIENLVYDGKAYPLHKSLEVALINVSKSGTRFRAPCSALLDCDRFQMRMKIGGDDKLLIADVVNHTDKDDGTSEYGCKFLVGSERAV